MTFLKEKLLRQTSNPPRNCDYCIYINLLSVQFPCCDCERQYCAKDPTKHQGSKFEGYPIPLEELK